MKKISITVVVILIIAVATVSILYLYKNDASSYSDVPPSFMYTDYGVYVPTQYSKYGIDVSRYQERINWKELKKMKVQNISIDFVFIKATEGKYMKDKMFNENWKEAKKNGIPRGAYHYYLPDGSPKVQARNFIETVALLPGDLPPVIDIEDRGIGIHSAFIKNINTFLLEVGNYCKCKPIVYSYDSFYNNYLKNHIVNHPLWLARYGAEKPEEGNFDFWQFTDHAQVDGIGPKVDMNVFSGDSLAFQKLLLK